MKKNKLVKIVILLIVIILVLFISQKMRQPSEEEGETPVRPAKVLTIKKEPLSITRIFPGRVKASLNADLTFEVPGRLEAFPVKEGERIEKGKLIANLDASDYISKRDASKAQFDKSEIDYKRAQELFKNDLIAESKLETFLVNYNVAKANYDTAEKAVDDTFIYAPYTGRISKKYVDDFEQVGSKEPIVNFQSLEGLDIKIDLPEQFIGFLQGYQVKFKIKFEQGDDTLYPLGLKEFSTSPDAQTKTYGVTLTMDRPKGIYVLPGMTASVYMELKREVKEDEETFDIPSHALIYNVEEEGSMVWLVDKTTMTVSKKSVETGLPSGSKIEVKKGLKEGDIIVVAGANQLMEGQKIRFYKEL